MKKSALTTEIQNLETNLNKMVNNIEQFSKSEVENVHKSVADLLALAEKVKRKHEKVEVS